MKRFFVETNGYNMVIFAGDDGKCFVIHEQSFDEELNFENAKNADYSNIENCNNAEECAYAMGVSDINEFIFNTEEILNKAEDYTEI